MSDHISCAMIARSLVAPDKGILAADESTATIGKHFDDIGLPSTVQTRRAYRDLLFTTEGIEAYLSGVILFDETIRQKSSNGMLFPTLLLQKGIIPGIKVDAGLLPLADAPGEMLTQGLDGLFERLKEYKVLGAQFTKWRAVFEIGEGMPSDYAIHMNAHALAEYAAIVQEAGMVPIVEPEVLLTGSHSIKDCFSVTRRVLKKVFEELTAQQVSLDGILLKPSMVLSGADSARISLSAEVAKETVRCLKQSVPKEVPGIVFLSGGQTEKEATEHLQEMNTLKTRLPWELSFSFGRALQHSTMEAWKGRQDTREEAQEIFLERCRLASLARMGQYSSDMEA